MLDGFEERIAVGKNHPAFKKRDAQTVLNRKMRGQKIMSRSAAGGIGFFIVRGTIFKIVSFSGITFDFRLLMTAQTDGALAAAGCFLLGCFDIYTHRNKPDEK